MKGGNPRKPYNGSRRCRGCWRSHCWRPAFSSLAKRGQLTSPDLAAIPPVGATLKDFGNQLFTTYLCRWKSGFSAADRHAGRGRAQQEVRGGRSSSFAGRGREPAGRRESLTKGAVAMNHLLTPGSLDPLALLAAGRLSVAVGLNHYLLLSAVLFAIGFFGVLLRRNTLVVYMCLELMLVASTIAAVAFSRYNGTMDGNIFVFFIITGRGRGGRGRSRHHCRLFRLRGTVQLEELTSLKN